MSMPTWGIQDHKQSLIYVFVGDAIRNIHFQSLHLATFAHTAGRDHGLKPAIRGGGLSHCLGFRAGLGLLCRKMPAAFLSFDPSLWQPMAMTYDVTVKRVARGAALGGVILLGAACGGSSATTPTVQPAPEPAPTPAPAPEPAPTPASGQSLNQMRTAQSGLISEYSPVTYTQLSRIPTTGTFTYNGYMGGTLSNSSDTVTDSVTGQMTAQITLTDSGAQVGGQVRNFRDASNAPMTGNLTLSGGALDRDGNPQSDVTLTMSANGTLRDSAGRDLVFGTRLEGDFLGSSHNAVGGDALGRVTYNGTSQNFDGTFIAER